MKTSIEYNNFLYNIDLSQPIDISLALQNNADAASAWYCPPTNITPVMTEHFIGDVKLGGSVNFRNVSFNPHGNGTHTECVGHISKEFFSINQLSNQYFFLAQVVTIKPTNIEEDLVITEQQIKSILDTSSKPQAFIIRTSPNNDSKRHLQYTNTNPPYVEAKVMNWLYEQGIRHFMIDTPSVDRELDEGKLAAHHAYWDYPNNPRLDATITELIFVPDAVKDGLYFVNMMMAAIENDASPSKPILYAIS